MPRSTSHAWCGIHRGAEGRRRGAERLQHGRVLRDHDAGHHVGVTIERFRHRVEDDVGAERQRALEVGPRERVVDDERHAGFACRGRGRLEIHEIERRVGRRLDVDHPRRRSHGGAKRSWIPRGHPGRHDTEAAHTGLEQPPARSVERLRRRHVVTRLQQGEEHRRDRRHAGRGADGTAAPLERGHARLQSLRGRVGETRVDWTVGAPVEARRPLLGGREHERRGLVNRYRHRALVIHGIEPSVNRGAVASLAKARHGFRAFRCDRRVISGELR